MNLVGPVAYREATVDGPVYEGDVLVTAHRQHLAVQLNDQTVLTLGANARMKIENWTERDSSNFLKRELFLERGVVRASVSRAYSDAEPLIVRTEQAALMVNSRAVNLTRFVFEARGDKSSELFVSEGRVPYASSKDFLSDPSMRVLLDAGFHSYASATAQRPQAPSRFGETEVTAVLARTAIPTNALEASSPRNRMPASAFGAKPGKRRAQEAFKE